MNVSIRILNGVTSGREFVLERQVVICGRDSKSDFVIKDENVSRRHCRFVTINDGADYQLEDLDSCNGTFVNDTSIQSKVLVVGDRIQIGDTQLELASASDPMSAVENLSESNPLVHKPKNITKQLVAAISHRINDLMQLSNGGEFLVDAGLDAKDFEKIAQAWEIVKRAQNRISRLSVNLTIHCHAFKPLQRRLNLHDLIDAATNEIAKSFDGARLKVTHQTTADFTLELDEYYCCRAIENVLCVGLMASEAGAGEQNKVTLETLSSNEDALIRVSFQHFDDRFDLAQLMQPEREIRKIDGELGLLELLVSREIVEGQTGTFEGICENENLNSIEVRFPLRKI